GSIGLLGLGMNHLAGLREATAAVSSARPSGRAKSCIYIFLSGGLAQHDSFDMKPEAPENIRGEFKPVATKTPGIQICEHLPRIAAIATAATARCNNLPPAVVLPERLVHWSGRVIPGQFAGAMGPNRDPWFIEASPYHNTSYGAFPLYPFDHQERGNKDERVF